MTDRYNGNNSGDIAFDPNSQGQGHDSTQVQGQGQHNVDPNRGDLAASEIRSGGRSPIQEQGQLESTTRSTHFGNRPSDNPPQAINQSADPDYHRQGPPRDRLDDQARSSGPGGGQDYGHPSQKGQWRQAEQKASENLPYGGAGRDPLQGGGHRDQVVGGPQEKFGAGNYGTTTGAGPGSRPANQDVSGDGNWGGKPPMPERVMGAIEKVVGKATGNVAMYERGQQNKTGGY